VRRDDAHEPEAVLGRALDISLYDHEDANCESVTSRRPP
jgi:hypothetical protein